MGRGFKSLAEVKLLKFESKREAKVCELAAAYLKVRVGATSRDPVSEWYRVHTQLESLQKWSSPSLRSTCDPRGVGILASLGVRD